MPEDTDRSDDGGAETKRSWGSAPADPTQRIAPFSYGDETDSGSEDTARPDDPGVTLTSISRFLDGSSDDMLFEPGKIVFGRYEIVEMLGRGGMGSVWLVRDLKFDALRAMKLIVSGIAYDAQVRARFAREAFVMAQISHPNAVIIHDAELTDRDRAYIVMEYIKGQGLDKLIQTSPPASPEWTARVLDQLCDVLQVAHERGIIHRDLKPSNLMLLDGRAEGKEHLKVLDFGIATIRDESANTELHTATGAFIGTPPYAAPEQAVGQADARSDVYAVGVILFELLTGRRPYSGPAHKLLYDTQFSPPPEFSTINPEVQVPGAVERVVLRCLDKDPDRRPQTPRALADEFLSALGPDLRADRGHRFEPQDDAHVGVIVTDGARKRRRVALAAVVVVGISVVVGLIARWKGSTWFPSETRTVTTAHENGTAAPEILRPAVVLPSGFEAFEDDRRSPLVDGYPRVIVRKEGGARLFQHPPGIYLPEGYEPEGTTLAADSWPAVIVRQKDRVRFCRLPGGEFLMGAFDRPPLGPADVAEDNQPAHKVRVSPFYMQEFEVTNGELFDYFNLARVDSRTRAIEWRKSLAQFGSDFDLTEEQLKPHPAVEVDHALAEEFARFRQGRLPREAEWEYAARSGGKKIPFVWGSEAASKKDANIDNLGEEDAPCLTLAQYVDRYPRDRTEQGVLALTGNLREWCHDRWGPYHDENPPPLDPKGPTAEGLGFVTRGGSTYANLVSAATTFRSRTQTDYDTSLDLGFRVVIGDLPGLHAAGR